jgi:hypothetical protein
MSDVFKRLAVPRELWREAMPNAPERVIRALETLSDYYDSEPDNNSNVNIDIGFASNAGVGALQQIGAIDSRIDEVELSATLGVLTQQVQSIQAALDDLAFPALPNVETETEDILPTSNPSNQAAAQFLFNATPIEFTPTVIGLTTAGVGTYTSQQGSAQLIGNRVYFNASLGWTAHTGTGDMAIGGLPIPALSTLNRLYSVSVTAITLTYTNQLTAYIQHGEQFVRLATMGSGLSLTGLPIDTAAIVHINGFYEV